MAIMDEKNGRLELLQLHDRSIFSTRKSYVYKRTRHSLNAKYLAWYNRGHNHLPISLAKYVLALLKASSASCPNRPQSEA